MLFTTRTMKRILILALGLFTLIHYPEAPAPHIALANAQDYAGRVRAAGRALAFARDVRADDLPTKKESRA
jgi:hypothetical protein